jgi:hypothetical protein
MKKRRPTIPVIEVDEIEADSERIGFGPQQESRVVMRRRSPNKRPLDVPE